jgi:dCMP deaminase
MEGGGKWDRNYLKLAEHVSQWSKDPSSQVGAVIVKNNHVIAVGYQAEVTDSDERPINGKIKHDLVVHAEINALVVAGKSAEGAHIYVYGRPICSACAGAIIQAGIVRVIAQDPPAVEGGVQSAVSKFISQSGADADAWTIKCHIARNMFSEARVDFDSYPHTCVEPEIRAQDNCPVCRPKSAKIDEKAAAQKPKELQKV